jgi:hypothetical protein
MRITFDLDLGHIDKLIASLILTLYFEFICNLPLGS